MIVRRACLRRQRHHLQRQRRLLAPTLVVACAVASCGGEAERDDHAADLADAVDAEDEVDAAEDGAMAAGDGAGDGSGDDDGGVRLDGGAVDAPSGCTPVLPPPESAPGRAADPWWAPVTPCTTSWLRCEGDPASRVQCGGAAVPFGACFVGAPPPASVCTVPLDAVRVPCALPPPGFLTSVVDPPAASLAVTLMHLDAEAPNDPAAADVLSPGVWLPLEHGIQGKYHLVPNPHVLVPLAPDVAPPTLQAQLQAQAWQPSQAPVVGAPLPQGPCEVAASVPVPKIVLERLDAAPFAIDPDQDPLVTPYRVAVAGVTPSGSGAATGVYLVFGASGKSCIYCGRTLTLRVALRLIGEAAGPLAGAWGEAVVPVRIYDTLPPDGGA